MEGEEKGRMHKILKRPEPQHFIDWKTHFRNNNGREPSYEDLAQSEEYARLKRELVEEQGYVCCYCEKEIGRNSSMRDCNIEHFMPRHPDAGLLSPDECGICRNAQMDYENMLASCLGEEQFSLDHCNHKKDNWYDFQYCISPIKDEIESIFGFRLNGKIFARGSNKSGEKMRQHLNLNTYALQEQRKKALDTVLEIEFDGDLLMDPFYIADTIEYYTKMDENGKYTPFCSMIAYCLREYYLS